MKFEFEETMSEQSIGHQKRRDILHSNFFPTSTSNLAIFAPSCSQISYAAQGGVLAISAQEFLSSLGVTTHVDQGIPGAFYVEPLRYLGVHNVRDGGRHSSEMQLLKRTTGVRLDLLCEGNLEGSLSIAKTLAASDALMAIEGPNEPNNFPITFDGQPGGGTGSWMPIARFQEALYRAVKRDPDLTRADSGHLEP